MSWCEYGHEMTLMRGDGGKADWWWECYGCLDPPHPACPRCGYVPGDSGHPNYKPPDNPWTSVERIESYEVGGACDDCVLCPKCGVQIHVSTWQEHDYDACRECSPVEGGRLF